MKRSVSKEGLDFRNSQEFYEKLFYQPFTMIEAFSIRISQSSSKDPRMRKFAQRHEAISDVKNQKQNSQVEDQAQVDNKIDNKSEVKSDVRAENKPEERFKSKSEIKYPSKSSTRSTIKPTMKSPMKDRIPRPSNAMSPGPQKVQKTVKGLKELSRKVKEMVCKKSQLTYRQVALNLIIQTLPYLETLTSHDRNRQEQNIKRRVYDALNVLIACKVLIKQGKRVSAHPTKRGKKIEYLRRKIKKISQRVNKKTENKKQLNKLRMVLQYIRNKRQKRRMQKQKQKQKRIHSKQQSLEQFVNLSIQPPIQAKVSADVVLPVTTLEKSEQIPLNKLPEQPVLPASGQQKTSRVKAYFPVKAFGISGKFKIKKVGNRIQIHSNQKPTPMDDIDVLKKAFLP